MMEFDEFFIMSILSKLTIEDLYYMITTPKRFILFILLSCYYMRLNVTNGLYDQRELF